MFTTRGSHSDWENAAYGALLPCTHDIVCMNYI